MRQVIQELDQESPVWNPEWHALKNMFPFSPHIPLSYGDVLMFVSHIIANIEVFWQTRQFLSSPGMPYMPPEIVNMIHRNVIRQKGIRQLPRTGFTLEPEFDFTAKWTPSENGDCFCYGLVANMSLSASKWQYNLRMMHPGGSQSTIEHHCEKCENKVPIESMEEFQGRHNELCGDPADIMPVCQRCHKKWGN